MMMLSFSKRWIFISSSVSSLSGSITSSLLPLAFFSSRRRWYLGGIFTVSWRYLVGISSVFRRYLASISSVSCYISSVSRRCVVGISSVSRRYYVGASSVARRYGNLTDVSSICCRYLVGIYYLKWKYNDLGPPAGRRRVGPVSIRILIENSMIWGRRRVGAGWGQFLLATQ